MTQVERVDAYTRQTLYVVMWGSVGLVLLSSSNAASELSNEFIVCAAGAILLTVAATPLLRDAMNLYPARGPLPWRTMTPYLALAAVYSIVGLTRPAVEIRTVVLSAMWLTAGIAFGGFRDRRIALALLVAITAVSIAAAAGAGHPVLAVIGLVCTLFIMGTVRVSLWLYSVVAELDQARQAQSHLAVAEERLRFSRDVHDVLGRRLSAIALQSELAATLARRGDASAADRMMEVRETANDSLREARELARGYRETTLPQELDGARALLRSAGIDVRLDVDDVPAPWQEAAGWVVREAVTNVLRHSAATMVQIEYTAPELRVRNDGVRDGITTSGSGLDGLRGRLATLGGDLRAHRDGDTFTVVATLADTRVDEEVR